MASISGGLLDLSDFYWPRANVPVLVSIPVDHLSYFNAQHDNNEFLQFFYIYDFLGSNLWLGCDLIELIFLNWLSNVYITVSVFQ